MNKKAMQRSFIQVIGPGLLFAGSAVGVSHLVQSTRDCSMYGLALVFFILLSMLAKYPAFSFAPRYAVATGRSLLSAYRKQGLYALAVFALSTVLTMFIGTGANRPHQTADTGDLSPIMRTDAPQNRITQQRR